jgi:hypothetical protein
MRLTAKETDLVHACLSWLALHRVKAWRTNNTGIYDTVRKTHRTFHGLKGVSDILGILEQPARLADGRQTCFGLFLAIEVKRPGEKPRAEQEEFLAGIRARGGIGLCVHSLDELDAGLRPYLSS